MSFYNELCPKRRFIQTETTLMSENPDTFCLGRPDTIIVSYEFFVFLPRNKIGTEIALYMAKEEGAPYYLI